MLPLPRAEPPLGPTTLVQRYRRGNADYARALLRVDTAAMGVIDTDARTAAAYIGTYVYPDEPSVKAVPRILAALVFVDATAALDVTGIDRQLAWCQKEKLVDATVMSKMFVNTSVTKLRASLCEQLEN